MSSSSFLKRTSATVTSEASERHFAALERGAASTDAISSVTLSLAPWVEHFDWPQPLFNERLEIRDGRMLVPSRSGLGFTLSDQARAWTTETETI